MPGKFSQLWGSDAGAAGVGNDMPEEGGQEKEAAIETAGAPAESAAPLKPRAPRRSAGTGATAKQSKATAATAAVPEAARGRGRPPEGGKRSDPDFAQTSIYLRKDTMRDIKVELLVSRDERDVSELAEELLSAWLDKRKRG